MCRKCSDYIRRKCVFKAVALLILDWHCIMNEPTLSRTLDRHNMMHRPWLAYYDSGVPHELEIPSIALPELLAQAAREYPATPAISFYGRTIAYAELDILASRFAA